MRELLSFSETKFTSRDIHEPFNVGILGNVSAVDPSFVSVDDIMKMRHDDELFSEFRSILENVFDQLYSYRDNYTDLDREFSERVRDQLLSWKDKLATKRKESSFTNSALESGEKVLIGIIAGAIIGAITAGEPGVG